MDNVVDVVVIFNTLICYEGKLPWKTLRQLITQKRCMTDYETDPPIRTGGGTLQTICSKNMMGTDEVKKYIEITWCDVSPNESNPLVNHIYEEPNLKICPFYWH